MHRPVHGARPHVMLFAQAMGDLLEDGAQVRFARAGRDHEKIRHGGKLAHVEHEDVFRLFVVRELAAKPGQSFRIHRR